MRIVFNHKFGQQELNDIQHHTVEALDVNINEYDNMFPDIAQLKCVSYKPYSKYMEQFKSLYKHFSTNSYQLEFICIVRWMCIYEYMKKNNITRAFICDSDVLIYDNINNLDELYLKKYEYMLCTSSTKNVTGGQSIWNLDKIEQFVIFVFKFYKTHF